MYFVFIVATAIDSEPPLMHVLDDGHLRGPFQGAPGDETK
jgi:hypothetical protein